MDETHLPTVTEVSTVLQTEEPDIIVDGKRKSEIRSLQLDRKNLWDELTKLKSYAQVLTIELFGNNEDVLKFYTALLSWTVLRQFSFGFTATAQ